MGKHLVPAMSYVYALLCQNGKIYDTKTFAICILTMLLSVATQLQSATMYACMDMYCLDTKVLRIEANRELIILIHILCSVGCSV